MPSRLSKSSVMSHHWWLWWLLGDFDDSLWWLWWLISLQSHQSFQSYDYDAIFWFKIHQKQNFPLGLNWGGAQLGPGLNWAWGSIGPGLNWAGAQLGRGSIGLGLNWGGAQLGRGSIGSGAQLGLGLNWAWAHWGTIGQNNFWSNIRILMFILLWKLWKISKKNIRGWKF